MEAAMIHSNTAEPQPEPDFTLLVEQYGTGLYRFCRSLTSSLQDAEDLYQQTFLQAIQLRSRLQADGNPRAYLYSVAKNLYRNSYRKQKRRRELVPETSLDQDPALEIPDCADPAADVEQRQCAVVVRDCISALPERYRIPVLLFYGQEMRISEIAAVCGCAQGTVKSRLARARQRLQKELEAKGYGRNETK